MIPTVTFHNACLVLLKPEPLMIHYRKKLKVQDKFSSSELSRKHICSDILGNVYLMLEKMF